MDAKHRYQTPLVVEHAVDILGEHNNYLGQVANNHAMAGWSYERMDHAPTDPRVAESYKVFRSETLRQWDVLEDAGLTVEFHDGEHSYPSSAAMLADLTLGHLWTLSTASTGELPEDHPMLFPISLWCSPQHPFNDIFRAVHDAMGHGVSGGSFGPLGEFAAWRAHRRQYSQPALAALWCETRGQSAWTNYYGNHSALRVIYRPFATQKAGWPPVGLV